MRCVLRRSGRNTLRPLIRRRPLHAQHVDGAPTQARAQLPAPYLSCDGLEYSDGWFYASYQGGKVVRFGLACGDEVTAMEL